MTMATAAPRRLDAGEEVEDDRVALIAVHVEPVAEQGGEQAVRQIAEETDDADRDAGCTGAGC